MNPKSPQDTYADAPRVVATNRKDRSLKSRGYHIFLALFLLPFLIIGVCLTLWGFDLIPKPNGYNVPQIIALSMGGLFGGIGFLGFFPQVYLALTWKESLLHKGKPWAECLWDPEGSKHATGPIRAFFGGLMVALFFALFGTPFFSIGFLGENIQIPFALAGIFFLVIVIISLGAGIYFALRAAKYGSHRITFSHFPFFLGEDLQVTFRCQNGIQQIHKITATLRCIRQTVSRSGRGNNRTTTHQAIYEDSQEFFDHYDLKPEEDLAIGFPLPADGETSDLKADRPIWWELIITADTAGVDFSESYHLPIYKQPASNSSAIHPPAEYR